MYNHLQIVQVLIDAGADINSQTNDGETALIFGKFLNNLKFLLLNFFVV
jgi:ankyrin repeat protein